MWVDAFCVNGIFLRNDGELADFGLISTCKEGRAVRYLLSGSRGFSLYQIPQLTLLRALYVQL